VTDRRLVLDASAVLAWVNAERGAEPVDRLLPHAVIPAPNLTETLKAARTRGHALTCDQLRVRIVSMGALIEPFVDNDTVRAAELLLYSAANPGPSGECLSLGDAQCIAVAERLDLPVVGDDRLWSALPLTVKFHSFR
jgi:PIN domain nuclease of toxin-antitoxin system